MDFNIYYVILSFIYIFTKHASLTIIVINKDKLIKLICKDEYASIFKDNQSVLYVLALYV